MHPTVAARGRAGAAAAATGLSSLTRENFTCTLAHSRVTRNQQRWQLCVCVSNAALIDWRQQQLDRDNGFDWPPEGVGSSAGWFKRVIGLGVC